MYFLISRDGQSGQMGVVLANSPLPLYDFQKETARNFCILKKSDQFYRQNWNSVLSSETLLYNGLKYTGIREQGTSGLLFFFLTAGSTDAHEKVKSTNKRKKVLQLENVCMNDNKISEDAQHHEVL